MANRIIIHRQLVGLALVLSIAAYAQDSVARMCNADLDDIKDNYSVFTVLAEMQELAERNRNVPDARVEWLGKWIAGQLLGSGRAHMEESPHIDLHGMGRHSYLPERSNRLHRPRYG
jgi:hypothetical protein